MKALSEVIILKILAKDHSTILLEEYRISIISYYYSQSESHKSSFTRFRCEGIFSQYFIGFHYLSGPFERKRSKCGVVVALEIFDLWHALHSWLEKILTQDELKHLIIHESEKKILLSNSTDVAET